MALKLQTVLILIVLAALMGAVLAACAVGGGMPTTAPTIITGDPATTQPVPATVQPVPATVQPVPATAQPVPATVQPVPATVQPAPVVTASPVMPMSPHEAVELLLGQAAGDFSLQTALPYLGPDLRAQVQAGQIDAGVLLIMQNPFTSYAIDSEYADGEGNVYVEARLFFGGATTNGAKRVFTLSRAEGPWHVVKVTDASVIPPPPADWPGPGWSLVAEGDLTGDGVSESVYCAPSPVIPVDSLGSPQLDGIATVCVEVLVSSPPATPDGDHTILLRVTQKELVAADRIIGPFASQEKPDGAAAHRLAVVPGAKVSVNILPLNPDGTAYAQGVGVYWNAAEGAFRFAGPDIWGTP